MLLRLRRELRDERTGASRNHCQVDAHNLALNTQGFDLNQLLAEPLEVVDRGISTLTPGRGTAPVSAFNEAHRPLLVNFPASRMTKTQKPH